MKKILVFFTGGTIGSKISGDIINVENDGKFSLIQAYERHFGKETKFECKQVLNILSENISFNHWEILIHSLSLVDTSQYSGIIITHGSDTLVYTSALLGMYFRHIDIPVYIIASNKPIGEKGSNGLFNFASAVKQIQIGKYKGVFTLYEKVYLPTRIMPADTFWDKFSSYGENEYLKNADFFGVSERMLFEKREKLFDDNIKLQNKVLLIHGYPGIDYSVFDFSKKPCCVLFVPYHSGTACASNEFGTNYSLAEFIKRCITQNIMVYICGIKKTNAVYDTLHSIISAGSIPLYNISEVSAYMKLLIAYNQHNYSVNEIMSQNLYFEIVKQLKI